METMCPNLVTLALQFNHKYGTNEIMRTKTDIMFAPLIKHDKFMATKSLTYLLIFLHKIAK